MENAVHYAQYKGARSYADLIKRTGNINYRQWKNIFNLFKVLAQCKSLNMDSMSVAIMDILDKALHNWNQTHNVKIAYYTITKGVIIHDNGTGEIRIVHESEVI